MCLGIPFDKEYKVVSMVLSKNTINVNHLHGAHRHPLGKQDGKWGLRSPGKEPNATLTIINLPQGLSNASSFSLSYQVK